MSPHGSSQWKWANETKYILGISHSPVILTCLKEAFANVSTHPKGGIGKVWRLYSFLAKWVPLPAAMVVPQGIILPLRPIAHLLRNSFHSSPNSLGNPKLLYHLKMWVSLGCLNWALSMWFLRCIDLHVEVYWIITFEFKRSLSLSQTVSFFRKNKWVLHSPQL